MLTLACALCPSVLGLHRHCSCSQSLCHSPTGIKMKERQVRQKSGCAEICDDKGWACYIAIQRITQLFQQIPVQKTITENVAHKL